MTTWIVGTDLTAAARQEALSRFVHRFTGQHKPAWANVLPPNLEPYSLQFADDAAWLAHTRFAVTKSGALDRRVTYCQSTPTWPNGSPARVSFTESVIARIPHAAAV